MRVLGIETRISLSLIRATAYPRQQHSHTKSSGTASARFIHQGGKSSAPPAAEPGSPEDKGQEPILSSLPLDDAEFREIVVEFIDKFREKLVAMHAALAAGDVGELKMLAHWLKGSGGSAGFPVLAAAAARLEQALVAGDRPLLAAGLADLDGLAARIAPAAV